jgi:hypothetical protein
MDHVSGSDGGKIKKSAPMAKEGLRLEFQRRQDASEPV